METRVLTLFDDDAFFPQETPKEKAPKEKPPKTAVPVKPTASENGAEPGTEEEQQTASPANTPVAETGAAEPEQDSTGTLPTEEAKQTPAAPMPAGLHKEWPAAAATAPEISIGQAKQEATTQEPEPSAASTEKENTNPPQDTAPVTTGPEDPAETTDEVTDAPAAAPAETPEEKTTPEEPEEYPAVIKEDVTQDAPAPHPENTPETETAQEVSHNTSIETAEADEPPATGTDTVAGTAESTPQENPEPGAAAETELDRQILSELIQLDYTALIRKDASFDISAATVVSRETPSKPAQGAASPADDMDTEELADDAEEVFEEVAPLPEWKLDKKYYTIGEVAQLFDANTSHIRFWTNEFKLRPRTTRKGDRLYTPKDIAELRLIHDLVKVKKHTIRGAREKIKSGKSDANNKLDLKESLIQLKDTLLKIRDQL